MNSFRRRRSYGQRRHEPLQLCTAPKDRQAAQLQSVVTWVGPPGSSQPVASLPPRRWRWLLYMLLAWNFRRAHDWLALRLGMQLVHRGPW